MTGALVGVAVIALVAFATEGAIGFGGTVLAASIGAQLVPLEVLLPAVEPLNIALSAYLLATGVRVVAWRLLAVEVAPPVAIGAIGGLLLAHVPAQGAMALGFGVFVVGLAVLQLARPGRGNDGDAPLPTSVRLGLLVVGGVAHGLFGTGGPMIVYVVRRRLAAPRAFRATLAVLWLALNGALLANFAELGRYTHATLDVGIALAIAIVPGLVIGDYVHRTLSPARFERAVWWLLAVAGAALAVRSAWAL